jgi:hypothetical protein
MAFEVVEFESPERSPGGARLLSSFRQRGFVVLLGSMISDWESTGLPPGMSLTREVAELLAEPLESPEQIKQWIRNAAFEHIMENCPNQDALGDNLLALFSRVNPNPVHRAIARLVADGIIEHMVTTNYDVNLEAACHDICPPSRRPQVIVTEEQAESLELCRPVLFKIHGCVEHDRRRGSRQPRSMIFTLGREGELPGWKRQLLHRVAAGRRLLVSGYSGRDFEICPELPRLQADVVWNAWPDARTLTPNARRVLTLTGGVALVSDMRAVLGYLNGGAPVQADRPAESPDLREKIARGLTDWDIALWRIRTLVAIGAATEGVRYTGLMRGMAGADADRQFHRLLNLGRCQFHAGSYRQAVATYREAALFSERQQQRDWLIEAKGDLIEALRCHGAWFKARKQLSEVEAMLDPQDDWRHAAMALRRVLLLRQWYQLAKIIKIVPWKVRALRRECKDLLKIVVQHSKDSHWLELQQAELWANRLDIPFAELYEGPLNPLPSKHGYQHLGYMIAESMALRDELRRRIEEPQDDVVQGMIEALNTAGALPELWKLVLLLIRTRGWNATTVTQRRAAFRAWRRSEYTPLMRVLATLFP